MKKPEKILPKIKTRFKCAECGVHFEMEAALKKHVYNAHDADCYAEILSQSLCPEEDTFPICLKCEYSFETRLQFDSHKCRQKANFHCFFCQESFLTEHILAGHMIKCNKFPQQPLQQQQPPKQQQLKMPIRRPEEKAPLTYSCNFCNRVFLNEPELMKHWHNVHSGKVATMMPSEVAGVFSSSEPVDDSIASTDDRPSSSSTPTPPSSIFEEDEFDDPFQKKINFLYCRQGGCDRVFSTEAAFISHQRHKHKVFASTGSSSGKSSSKAPGKTSSAASTAASSACVTASTAKSRKNADADMQFEVKDLEDKKPVIQDDLVLVAQAEENEPIQPIVIESATFLPTNQSSSSASSSTSSLSSFSGVAQKKKQKAKMASAENFVDGIHPAPIIISNAGSGGAGSVVIESAKFFNPKETVIVKAFKDPDEGLERDKDGYLVCPKCGSTYVQLNHLKIHMAESHKINKWPPASLPPPPPKEKSPVVISSLPSSTSATTATSFSSSSTSKSASPAATTSTVSASSSTQPPTSAAASSKPKTKHVTSFFGSTAPSKDSGARNGSGGGSEGKVVCDLCEGENLIPISALENHMITAHFSKVAGREMEQAESNYGKGWRCFICDQFFQRTTSLKAHARIKHDDLGLKQVIKYIENNGGAGWSCRRCGEHFQGRKSLNSHLIQCPVMMGRRNVRDGVVLPTGTTDEDDLGGDQRFYIGTTGPMRKEMNDGDYTRRKSRDKVDEDVEEEDTEKEDAEKEDAEYDFEGFDNRIDDLADKAKSAKKKSPQPRNSSKKQTAILQLQQQSAEKNNTAKRQAKNQPTKQQLTFIESMRSRTRAKHVLEDARRKMRRSKSERGSRRVHSCPECDFGSETFVDLKKHHSAKHQQMKRGDKRRMNGGEGMVGGGAAKKMRR